MPGQGQQQAGLEQSEASQPRTPVAESNAAEPL
jgi:hypothetical protein